jgi:hypothetical protein
MSAMRYKVLIGHDWEVDRLRCGSVPDVVKCGQLFMVSQSRAGHGTHSSGSLPTRSASPIGSTMPDTGLGAAGFNWGQVLSGLMHPPLPTDW